MKVKQKFFLGKQAENPDIFDFDPSAAPAHIHYLKAVAVAVKHTMKQKLFVNGVPSNN